MELPVIDCIGSAEYNENGAELNPIDCFNHYRFVNLPGHMAIFTLNFGGSVINLNYDMTEVSEEKIIELVNHIENHLPGQIIITVLPGSDQQSKLIYENDEITFIYNGSGNSYSSFMFVVPAASLLTPLSRLV
jgi:hypothetical protein